MKINEFLFYSQKIRPKSNSQFNFIAESSSLPSHYIIECGYSTRSKQLMLRNHIRLQFPMGNQVNSMVCNYVNDDTASMALPNGHAASTRASPYLTCFTNVISCQGSRPVQETQAAKMHGSEF